jgi:hypothetical protein
MSTIHSSWVPVGVSDCEIEGRAKLSTVASTATSSTGSIRTARAIHSRTPARGPADGVVERVTGAPVAEVAIGCRVEVMTSQLQVVRTCASYYTDQTVQ